MLVATPRMRNSASARLARATADGKSRARHVSLASIESKCGLICDPAAVVPPSRRMPAPPGRTVGGDAAGVRAETLRRIFRRDAALQSSAAQHDVALIEPEVLERLTRGDADLGLDEVDVRDLFGHGVLDLDARVHLDEHVLAGALARRVHAGTRRFRR